MGVLPAFSIGVSYLVAFLAYHVPVAFADAGVDGACCYLLIAPS